MAKENYQCHNDLVDNMEEIIQLTLGQVRLSYPNAYPSILTITVDARET